MTNKIIKKALNFLDENNIEYKLLEHEAVFTVEDVENLNIKIEGDGIKTLFLRDRKGKNFYLVAIRDDKRIDLKSFAQTVGEKRLNFATEQNLDDILQVKAGSISPMALINDNNKKVSFYLDEDLANSPKITMHPNLNTATIILDANNFQKYLNLVVDNLKITKI